MSAFSWLPPYNPRQLSRRRFGQVHNEGGLCACRGPSPWGVSHPCGRARGCLRVCSPHSWGGGCPLSSLRLELAYGFEGQELGGRMLVRATLGEGDALGPPPPPDAPPVRHLCAGVPLTSPTSHGDIGPYLPLSSASHLSPEPLGRGLGKGRSCALLGDLLGRALNTVQSHS